MKRPTKAEKVSRQINEPIRHKERSLSPSNLEETRSAIPLFNTSAKRRNLARLNDDIMSVDSSKPSSPIVSGSDKEMEIPMGEEGQVGDGGKLLLKKKSLKEKIKVAREGLKDNEERSKAKVTGKASSKGRILGGVDYLKLHEKGESRFSKKKLR